MPKVVQRGKVPYSPSAGWNIGMNTDAQGGLVPTCAPAGITSKATVGVGQAFSQGKLGGPKPIIEASHKATIPRG